MASGLAIPGTIRACLFDVDGLLRQSPRLHAQAWKLMFDGFLRTRAQRTGEPFVPFDPVEDYEQYVDGRPRYDGVRTFLAARRIKVPEGRPNDPPGAETITALGDRKNQFFLGLIRSGGVKPYAGSVRFVRAVRKAGLLTAVVSTSANCLDVLVAAGIDDLFDERVDGVVAERHCLRGKPASDTYLFAARALGAEPAQAAVFDDTLAGLTAGRAGRFGFVVGIDRVDQADELRAHGADVVVGDLEELIEDRAPVRQAVIRSA
jgi:HAD superfamily hydrolase (TIGR01509 family)